MQWGKCAHLWAACWLTPHKMMIFVNYYFSLLLPQVLGRAGKPPSSDRWGSSTDEASQRRRGRPSPNASFRTSSQPWRPWREPWPCSKSPTQTQRTRYMDQCHKYHVNTQSVTNKHRCLHRCAGIRANALNLVKGIMFTLNKRCQTHRDRNTHAACCGL